jgi:hypothetical protein
MDRVAFGQLFHGFFTIYPVDKFYTAPDFFVQGGLDDQPVVISGRGRKFAVAFGDRQKNTAVLDGLIGHPPCPKQFRPSDFEPAKIISVVGETHVVGVAINDPAGRSMRIHFFLQADSTKVKSETGAVDSPGRKMTAVLEPLSLLAF